MKPMREIQRVVRCCFGVLCVSGLAGCSEEGPGGAPTDSSTPPDAATDVGAQGLAHPYRSDATAVVIEGDTSEYTENPWSFRNATLCEHVYYADGGAGLYRVVNATGVLEQANEPGAVPESVTYFELEQLEDWGGDSPSEVTLRIRGGPTADGGFVGLYTYLEEGEEVGVLLKGAEEDANAGFAAAPTEWVWRPNSEGLYQTAAANLRLTRDDLASLISEAYAALPDVDLVFNMECRIQVPWDQCPEGTLIPAEAELIAGQDDCDATGRHLPGHE